MRSAPAFSMYIFFAFQIVCRRHLLGGNKNLIIIIIIIIGHLTITTPLLGWFFVILYIDVGRAMYSRIFYF